MSNREEGCHQRVLQNYGQQDRKQKMPLKIERLWAFCKSKSIVDEIFLILET